MNMWPFKSKQDEQSAPVAIREETPPAPIVKVDAVHPAAEGFVERVTPQKPTEGVFFFKCECGHTHFRHAGYMKVMVPFMRAGGEKRVSVENHQVMICVKCRKSYIWINEQMYEVTDQVDVSAWEKSEVAAHRATGPGGQC